MELKRTGLYDAHVAAGARMVPFAGWEMPVQYPTGPLVEHHNVRENAGLFDIDHMGQFTVTGADALQLLQRLVTSNVAKLKPSDAGYGLLCYADGGVIDDVFIYCRPGDYFVVVNASNRAKDLAWMQAHIDSCQAQVTDVSDKTYMLALQGPKAADILGQVASFDVAPLEFHKCTLGQVLGIPTFVGRTGYTGEDGFELFFPAERAQEMWNGLLEAGKPYDLKPTGLAARDSLRFEPGLALYGHEISANIDPISAGLSWAVKFDKGDFIGREALLRVKLEGPRRKLVGFEMIERGVPRQGYPVVKDDQVVGEVTTGMMAPTSGRFVGLAYVPAELSTLDTPIQIQVRGKNLAAKVVKRPFYQPAYRRKSQ